MQQASKFALHLSFVRLKRRKTAYQGCSVLFFTFSSQRVTYFDYSVMIEYCDCLS